MPQTTATKTPEQIAAMRDAAERLADATNRAISRQIWGTPLSLVSGFDPASESWRRIARRG